MILEVRRAPAGTRRRCGRRRSCGCQRYAERRGFKAEELATSGNEAGGIKEAVVRGQGRRRVLAQVGGRHAPRAARPATEAQGRIHTSTATVAVLPEAEEVDVEIDANDLQIDVYRSPARAARASTRPTPRCASRTCRPASSSDAGREVAAQEQGEGDARAARAALRARAREAAGGARRAAPRPGRHRRARREDPHVQLPSEPAHGPPHQAEVHQLDQILAGELDEFTEALKAEERRRALER